MSKQRPDGGIRKYHSLGTRVRGSGRGNKQAPTSPAEVPHGVRWRVQGEYMRRPASVRSGVCLSELGQRPG